MAYRRFDAAAPARARPQRHGDVDVGRQALFERALDKHIAAFGPDAMARVRAALAVYLGLERIPEADPRQKPKFFWMPGIPATPYFDRALFPWHAALESAVPAIRGELQAVLGSDAELIPFLGERDPDVTAPYLGGDPRSRAWDAYFLHRHGGVSRSTWPDARRRRGAGLGPLTASRDHAPEVLFSVLAPQHPHQAAHGVTNTRVVTHLPLIIPEGDCKLVVGGEPHAWRKGVASHSTTRSSMRPGTGRRTGAWC